MERKGDFRGSPRGGHGPLRDGRYWTRRLDLVGGCTKVSEGCLNCWLEPESHMRRHNPTGEFKRIFAGTTDDKGEWTGEVNCNEFLLEKLVEWKKPEVIQVWSDLFHPKVPFEYALKCIDRFQRHPEHTFLIGTKRPERAVEFCVKYGLIPDHTGLTGSGERIPPNVWLLVTVENQKRLEERIAHILRWPGWRALSLEPCLSAIDLTHVTQWEEDAEWRVNLLTGEAWCENSMSPSGYDQDEGMKVHQVILGGENEKKGRWARPLGPDWARKVRDDCKAAGVSFYFKGWGEHKYAETQEEALNFLKEAKDPKVCQAPGSSLLLYHIGRKKAGRELDGRTHDKLAWGKE